MYISTFFYLCRIFLKASNKNLYLKAKNALIESDGFGIVCLSKPVLRSALSAMNQMRGDSMGIIDNKAYRFSGYNQYTFLVRNHLPLHRLPSSLPTIELFLKIEACTS